MESLSLKGNVDRVSHVALTPNISRRKRKWNCILRSWKNKSTVVILTSPHKKKSKSKDLLFLSNPKDWYVISRERVCNIRRRMASRVSVYPPSD